MNWQAELHNQAVNWWRVENALERAGLIDKKTRRALRYLQRLDLEDYYRIAKDEKQWKLNG